MFFRDVKRIGRYDRTVAAPPDKSISVRAVVLCAYAVGQSTVNNISLCDDVMSAVSCVRSLGATVDIEGNTAHITGAPFRSATLDCGNSATTARLLAGLLAGLNGVFELVGDESLSSRSMERIITPLSAMGGRVTGSNGRLPLTVVGSALGGIEYFMPINSAQVKSAILLAGLNSARPVTVTEKLKTRDHTEIMLKKLGAAVFVDGNAVTLSPSILYGDTIDVPGDISAAVYPICLALATSGSCTVKNVGLNKTRTAVLDILRSAGADVTAQNVTDGDEPRGDIVVRGGSKLKPFDISGDDVAAAIDEIPALCALACFIDGRSVVRGAGELRVKESDRIKSVVGALSALGADITETDDGIVINGGKPLKHGVVETYGDHRIAMSAAIAAAAGGGARIVNADCVSVSYPHFFEEVIGT